MSLTIRELQDELNLMAHNNDAGFKALSELLMGDVQELCNEQNITDPAEITALMNTAQFNFEFKFGFNLAMAKLKLQIGNANNTGFNTNE